MPLQSLQRSEKALRLDDEVRFIRSWLEKPLATGAVTPSGRVLARTMARYVEPEMPGPVVELGPGTGPVTEALIEHGVSQDRLVLLEFNPTFCQLLRQRFPRAKMILTVHDELLFEAPVDQKDEVAALVRDTMSNAASLTVPLDVDVGIGENWKEAKS